MHGLFCAPSPHRGAITGCSRPGVAALAGARVGAGAVAQRACRRRGPEGRESRHNVGEQSTTTH